MMKKRKDSGFTLIELMIVIAVIGILAIVLVPKVGLVKTQAKETGLDVNVRAVQAYTESKIDKWISTGKTSANVQTDITAAFTGTNKSLTNPFTSINLGAANGDGTGASAIANAPLYLLDEDVLITAVTHSASNTRGTIIVHPAPATGTVSSITIYACDNDGTLVSEKTVVIAP